MNSAVSVLLVILVLFVKQVREETGVLMGGGGGECQMLLMVIEHYLVHAASDRPTLFMALFLVSKAVTKEDAPPQLQPGGKPHPKWPAWCCQDECRKTMAQEIREGISKYEDCERLL